MRKLGMVLLVVCLLGTVPVMAADGQERGGWWGGVVEWIQSTISVLDGSSGNPPATTNTNIESEQEIGGSAEPNG